MTQPSNDLAEMTLSSDNDAGAKNNISNNASNNISSEQKQISVVVVDDHPLFRRGVVELVNDSALFKVNAEYGDGQDLLAQFASLEIDILLLDLQMPRLSGIDLLKQIRQLNQTVKIVIITASEAQDSLIEALKLGANGYLRKDTPADEIIAHLKAVYAGNVALNIEALTPIAQALQSPQPTKPTHTDADDRLNNMTEREQQTLLFIAKGLNNKLIARELGISDGTVKVYVKSLLRKLDLHSRLELAAWAHNNLNKDLLS